MGDDEWGRDGSFMKKPSSGWLHDDAALMQGDGIYYPVKVLHATTPLIIPKYYMERLLVDTVNTCIHCLHI